MKANSISLNNCVYCTPVQSPKSFESNDFLKSKRISEPFDESESQTNFSLSSISSNVTLQPTFNKWINLDLKKNEENKTSLNFSDQINEIKQELLQLVKIEQQIKQLAIQVTSIRENITQKMNQLFEEVDKMTFAKDYEESKQKKVQLKQVTNLGFLESNKLCTQNKISLNQIKLKFKNLPTLDSHNRFIGIETLTQLSEMQKLPAFVKGYLTRRLLKTEKVKDLIKIIKDTSLELESYKSDKNVDYKEIEFHKRLIIQLEKSMVEFHDVFFRISKNEQMKLISRSREFSIEKTLRRSNAPQRLSSSTTLNADNKARDRKKENGLIKNFDKLNNLKISEPFGLPQPVISDQDFKPLSSENSDNKLCQPKKFRKLIKMEVIREEKRQDISAIQRRSQRISVRNKNQKSLT